MKLIRDHLVGLYPAPPTPTVPSGAVHREEAMARAGLPVGHLLRPLQRSRPETMKNRALQET